MNTQQKKGFTIIEVVLVLAIAGLIFLMVFIALPALQRGQRDQARKNDAHVVAAAINTYKGNNRGSLSGLNANNLRDYVDRLDQYDVAAASLFSVTDSSANANPGLEQIVVRTGRKCGTTPSPANAHPLVTGTSRTAAVIVTLENNGNQTQAYCTDI